MASSAADRHLETARTNRAAGRVSAAVESYRRVLEKNAAHPEALYELAELEASAGRYESAASLLQRALSARVDWPEATNDLGIALHHLGHKVEALEAFRRAVALAPQRGDFLNNLANGLRQAGQLEEATAVYSAALSLNPNDPFCNYNMGMTQLELGRSEGAAASFGKTLAARGDYAPAYHLLGAALMQMHRWTEAAAVLQRATSLDPSFAEAHSLLGQALVLLQRRVEGIAAFRRAIELKPDDDAYRFHLAAQTGDASMSYVPDRFVKSHFNDFATKFDGWLVNDLKYRAPEDLLRCVRSVDQRDQLDVLDLGCGTGLCGVQFKPYARRMVGIDLAGKMLEQAQARGIYDELIEINLLDYLRASNESCDLIVAGDVFIYVGDMSQAIPACASALRPGGVLAFSMERHDGSGFHLHPGGRFSHSIQYVREITAQTDLVESVVNDIPLREEGGVAVPGWTIVLRKPATA